MSLEFVPLHNFMSGGTNIQVCQAKYKNHYITWRTYFPWSVFEKPCDEIVVDRVLPMNEKVPNATMSDDFYTPEGYGLPVFKDVDHAIEFIDSIKQ